MAKRSGFFDDLVEIAAHMPWWLSLGLAMVSYVVIHPFSLIDISAPKNLQGMGEMVSSQMIKVFATMGQYLIPAAFGLGAFGSWVARRRRAKLYLQVAGQPGKHALAGISWRQFEMLVGESFRKQGYVLTETGGVADGGVDLVLRRDGETYLVQCKQWKAYKVGVNIVRELLGVMATQGAAGGFIVTSGVFTQDAIRFASDCNIKLIDGSQLFNLIRSAQASPPVQTAPQKPAQAPPAVSAPACPKCGSAMVARRASKGANAGQSFWGCPKYPACRGTRPF